MSASDNKFINKTLVTTATSAADLWLNVGGAIRRITVANFATAFASLFGSVAKRQKIRTITANASATTTDNVILMDTSGGNVDLTLPSAADMYSSGDTDTVLITAQQINHTSNTATVYPATGNTIDGAASYALTSDSGASFVSDGSNIWSTYK